jgi:hypothetical protein
VDSSVRNSAAKYCRWKTEEIVFATVEWDCSQLGENFVVAAVDLGLTLSLAKMVEREMVSITSAGNLLESKNSILLN